MKNFSKRNEEYFNVKRYVSTRWTSLYTTFSSFYFSMDVCCSFFKQELFKLTGSHSSWRRPKRRHRLIKFPDRKFEIDYSCSNPLIVDQSSDTKEITELKNIVRKLSSPQFRFHVAIFCDLLKQEKTFIDRIQGNNRTIIHYYKTFKDMKKFFKKNSKCINEKTMDFEYTNLEKKEIFRWFEQKVFQMLQEIAFQMFSSFSQRFEIWFSWSISKISIDQEFESIL